MIYTIVSYMDTLAMLVRCQIRLDSFGEVSEEIVPQDTRNSPK